MVHRILLLSADSSNQSSLGTRHRLVCQRGPVSSALCSVLAKLVPLPEAGWHAGAVPQAGLPVEWFKQNLWASFSRPEDTCLREWPVSGSTGRWRGWKQAVHKPVRWDVFALLIPRKPPRPRNNHDIASSLFTVILLN